MELEGIIIFKLSNIGSHNENINPFIYLGKGKFVKIYFPNDNPFYNESLKPYDGKVVSLSGDYDEYEGFVIDKINDLQEELVFETSAEEKNVDDKCLETIELNKEK